ncbi:MAG: glycosyltransferase family 2 protein [Campylobacterales bacterium]|nr:glycosyltransferase family 2 protein [Campylobacterales bacterium]
MAPMISILIPTYNREKDVEKAVLSCLLQDYQNIEIIVTDNSDNSATEKIIKKINSDKVRYYKNSKNIGPILNWRKAFEYSSGDWVLILPDDDYLINPFYLSDCVQIISEEKVDLIITDCILGYPTYNLIGKSNNIGIKSSKDVLETFWQTSHIPTIANLFSKDVVKGLEFFYSNSILYSDIELWLKILNKSKYVYFYNVPSVYYTFHEQNIVKTMQIDSLISNAIFIVSIFKNNPLMEKLYMQRYCLFVASIYPNYGYDLVVKLSKEYKLGTLWLLTTISTLNLRKVKKVIKWILKK